MKKTSSNRLDDGKLSKTLESAQASTKEKDIKRGRPRVKDPLKRLSVGLSVKYVELINADIETAASEGQMLTLSEVIRRAIHAHYKVAGKL